MTGGDTRFLEFYERYRRGAQCEWYRRRCASYERAHRQSVSLTALVLFLSSVVSTLSAWKPDVAVGGGYALAWPVIATVLAAAGTALAAHRALYGFQQNAGIYRDAEHALAAASADSPDGCEGCADAPVRTPAEYVARVEQVFQREQGQWGQLVAQVRGETREAKPAAAPSPRPVPSSSD